MPKQLTAVTAEQRCDVAREVMDQPFKHVAAFNLPDLMEARALVNGGFELSMWKGPAANGPDLLSASIAALLSQGGGEG